MSQYITSDARKPVTVPMVKANKVSAGAAPLSVLTAYDYPTARLLDEAGIELILVGDSVGTVMYGEPNTLSVTMEQMLLHARAVRRGTARAMVIADMPFMSYQVSLEQAVTNAGRFLKEAGANAVKLEGGIEFAPTIAAITRAGIPVCAHIGLTPQSIQALGSYRMHGKSPTERDYLLQSAKAVADAGAFAVVLECVETGLAREITENVAIPTIGIGAGQGCDGQVLVFHDLVGLTAGHVPKFVQPTCQGAQVLSQGVQEFIRRTRGEKIAVADATEKLEPILPRFSLPNTDAEPTDDALSH